jgi:UDP-3-O-[3-hydroxymyristoyl] N-acetylglucosamine deacetylase
LKQNGFAKGGSLENAVVIDKEKVLNPEGLRYTNEPIRHKILDCIGDLSMLGMPIMGHIIAHKSGHAMNHSLLRRFVEQKACWETAQA